MRLILLITLITCIATTNGQSVSPSDADYFQSAGLVNNNTSRNSVLTHKWFFSAYRGISTGISFFRGGNATFLAAPMGLQLNRRLNNNLYGFANITVAPTYISFNRSFISAGSYKGFGYGMPGINTLGANPAVSLGLMYINDQKTFSISGSISAERSSYPLLPYYPPGNSRYGNIIASPGSK